MIYFGPKGQYTFSVFEPLWSESGKVWKCHYFLDVPYVWDSKWDFGAWNTNQTIIKAYASSLWFIDDMSVQGVQTSEPRQWQAFRTHNKELEMGTIKLLVILTVIYVLWISLTASHYWQLEFRSVLFESQFRKTPCSKSLKLTKSFQNLSTMGWDRKKKESLERCLPLIILDAFSLDPRYIVGTVGRGMWQ